MQPHFKQCGQEILLKLKCGIHFILLLYRFIIDYRY